MGPVGKIHLPSMTYAASPELGVEVIPLVADLGEAQGPQVLFHGALAEEGVEDGELLLRAAQPL